MIVMIVLVVLVVVMIVLVVLVVAVRVAAIVVVVVVVVVMVVLLLFDLEIVQLLDTERSYVQDLLEVNLGVLRLHHRRKRVDRSDLLPHLAQLFLVHQIGLVQQNLVRKGDLLHGLVHHALRHLLPKVLQDVSSVHHRHDGVHLRVLLEELVELEGDRDGGWIRHASRLHDDVIKVVPPLEQVVHGLHQVAAHRAAHASVVQGEDLLRHAIDLDEAVVDGDLSELVLDHSNLVPVFGRQNIVQQRRLPRSKETRNNRHRDGRLP
mmetsp:Transcript_5293/g.15983  ORF Transcript_5293/g.15983 Transcript_5293/m.15983 type:complete len:264 (-) Transcript_5293:157-948(-)